MKVKELIRRLSKFDSNCQVNLVEYDEYPHKMRFAFFNPVRTIYQPKNSKEVVITKAFRCKVCKEITLHSPLCPTHILESIQKQKV